MSSMRKTTTRTATTTRRDVHKALRKAELTREEELVLRLRHGLSEPGATHLEFRGTTHPELAAKLALIEADALAHMRPHVAVQVEAAAETGNGELKQSIIDKLKKL